MGNEKLELSYMLLGPGIVGFPLLPEIVNADRKPTTFRVHFECEHMPCNSFLPPKIGGPTLGSNTWLVLAGWLVA